MRRTVATLTLTLTVAVIAVGLGVGGASAAPLMGSVITTASQPGDQYEPAVAWDNEHKRWLVVWEQDVSGVRAIVGRVVANNGYPFDNAFVISDDPAKDATAPDVVYDPGHDRYLVVWVHQFSATDTDILGRFVRFDGVQPAVPFPIENPTTLQFAPVIEYNPAPVDEYFVVWENLVDFDPETIRAKRLYPDSGSQVGPSYEVVGDATYHRREPRLAWNADASRYLVVYERYQGSDQEDVYARSLSWSGGTIGSEFGIAAWSGEENQIDVAACDGSWMVVWKGATEVYARPVADDLAVGALHNLSTPYVGDSAPAVACNPHGAEFFVVWQKEFSGGTYGVVGGFLDPAGALLDRFNVGVSSGANPLDNTRPAVSVGDYQRRAFVVWETERDDHAHQDLAGRWVDMALFSDFFEAGNSSRWSATVP